MQKKVLPSKKPANRKHWGLTLNIQLLVCQNKMTASKENLLPFSTRYVPCLMTMNSMLIYKMDYESKLFWEGKEKHPVFNSKLL